mgnify:CR=1 FL=1
MKKALYGFLANRIIRRYSLAATKSSAPATKELSFGVVLKHMEREGGRSGRRIAPHPATLMGHPLSRIKEPPYSHWKMYVLQNREEPLLKLWEFRTLFKVLIAWKLRGMPVVK